MKKIILTFAFTGLMVATNLTAFAQDNKKTEAAQKEDAEDYRKFKKEAEEKIADNKERIAELKTKKANESNEVKAKYDKKVVALEQKNNDLKKKIDSCNDSKDSKWTSFKREFNHDMDELGKSIKDLTVDNAK